MRSRPTTARGRLRRRVPRASLRVQRRGLRREGHGGGGATRDHRLERPGRGRGGRPRRARRRRPDRGACKAWALSRPPLGSTSRSCVRSRSCTGCASSYSGARLDHRARKACSTSRGRTTRATSGTRIRGRSDAPRACPGALVARAPVPRLTHAEPDSTPCSGHSRGPAAGGAGSHALQILTTEHWSSLAFAAWATRKR